MNPYSNDLRQKIVDAYKHNEGSLRVLARRFSVSLSFVRDLVKLERTTGKVMAKPHAGGSTRKISGANLLILRELVERHREATLANLCEMYVALTRQEVSVSTVGLALRRMHYTRKKKTLRASERVSNDKLDAERKAFQAEWATRSVDHLPVLDETGIHLGMTSTYGRALRGRRVEGTAPAHPGMNITVVGSLGRYGMTSMMMLPGALDGIAFKAYVDACLVPVLRQGDVVLMDNLRVHKVKGTEAAIEQSGAKVKFLPPYSPDLSPIELAWSKDQRTAAPSSRTDL